ncbi:unnamed protein product, partial [Mesorhabditis belari]|uniref:Uncharacterized protein n=1 Tax=Mesorhabditis belari TaxID=2138241 RepID=A0AAF3EUS9_9BILA
MTRRFRIFLLLTLTFHYGSTKIVIGDVDDDPKDPQKNNPLYDPKEGVTKINITKDSAIELRQHWLEQAFSGLMAAVVQKKTSKLKREYQDIVHKCSKQAHSVEAHAKCVMQAIELHKDPKNAQTSRRHRKRVLQRLNSLERINDIRRKHKDNLKIQNYRKRRVKRAIKQTTTYTIKDKMDQSPFGIVASHLTNALRKLSGDERPKAWRTIVSEVEQKGQDIRNRRKLRKMMSKRFEAYQKAAKQENIEIDDHRPLAMKELEMGEEDEKTEMLRLAEKKMKNMTLDEQIGQAPVKLMREVVKMGLMMSGQNTTDFDKKNIKMLSPRILSIMQEDDEEKKDDINLLSPALFSLHGEGDRMEKKMSLHSALGGVSGDGDHLLNLIIEASGVGHYVDMITKNKLEEVLAKEEPRGPNGERMYWDKEKATKYLGDHEMRKIASMERLTTMYTPEQMREMKESGFTAMTPRQADFIYGDRSPFNDTVTLQRIKGLFISDMFNDGVDDAISETISRVATGHSKFEVRQHDIVLSPIINTHLILNPALASQPIILSPVLFSSLILSPGIFGPVILSPWVFVAGVLSPRILSPVILTPFAFVPIILTPFAMDPIILSPGIFNPIILSPLLMSPFILSPQVCTPVILSPIALSPFILTPNLMSPLILSPFVLTPIVMSPAYVGALILSPYALSPAIASSGAAVSVIASPSFLS